MPKVQHTILQWARETAQQSLEKAAHKLNLKGEENLVAYEEGKREPSRPLLKRMSKVYHQPLLTFYLNKPPIIKKRGQDFRTLPDHYSQEENANVDILIRDIRACQSVIKETLIDVDEEIRLGFIGKHTLRSGKAAIIETIREAFGFDLEEFRKQPSNKDAFQYLRLKVEKAGVFVLLKGNLGSHHSNIALDVFRGFALADDIAPFIVLNDQDAHSAWSFTLLHELVHLVLGQTGISSLHGEKEIEKFCNNVASEILLPKVDFDQFKIKSHDFETLAANLTGYAGTRKLSSSHIAYRLYRRGDIDREIWEELITHYRDLWNNKRKNVREKNKEVDGGPNYYVVKNYKLGSLVPLVQRLTYSGDISTTTAGMLLGVRPLKVHQLFHL